MDNGAHLAGTPRCEMDSRVSRIVVQFHHRHHRLVIIKLDLLDAGKSSSQLRSVPTPGAAGRNLVLTALTHGLPATPRLIPSGMPPVKV